MEALQEEKGSAILSQRYLFKSTLDAVLYLVVYLGLPLYSIIQGINHDDGTIYFTALSCCVCVVYDCFSRYDKASNKKRIQKIYGIGIVHGVLAMYIFYDIQCYMENGAVGCPWIYISLAVAPVIGGTDFFNMIRDDWRARGD